MMTGQISHNLKILVADDDPEVLDLFRQVLSSSEFHPAGLLETEALECSDTIHRPPLSFDLVTCRQGDAAVNEMKQSIENNRPFSVAFIDIRMPPGPDGIWTAEQIRLLDENVEILIMTGYSDAHPQEIARRVPPVHKLLYFQKPFHSQEIYQFASALSMKWHTECEYQKLNKFLEQCIEDRIEEVITLNKELQKKLVELQKAQSALQASETRYRALTENSRVGIWQTTLDGHTIYINPEMCRILEIEDPEELHGKSYHSFYNAKNLEIVKRELAKREKGLSSTYEVEITGSKGTRRNLMVSGAPIFFSEDKIHSAIGTFTDITDKNRAELALKEAHDNLEHLVHERTVALKNALEKVKRGEKELIRRKSALEILNNELVETNQAVSVLARNIDRKKEELEKKVYDICTGKLMPILKKLQKDVHCKKREADLELIINYLNGIVHETPLSHHISSHLTEQEMRVAMLIKNGLTSQKIADMLCISMLTVKTHRKNIRKKLNIDNKDINLVSYLKSRLASEPIYES